MSSKQTPHQLLNVNIDKEDHNLNDYLYCWTELNERPNKISLFSHYQSTHFLDLIDELKLSYNGIFTEIIPTGVDYLVNEKVLTKIHNSLFISYIQYDKNQEDSFIGEVNLIYLNDASEKLSEILQKLQEIEIDLNHEDANQRINTISVGQSGLEIVPIELMNADYENIENYFNDDTIKKADKLIKSLKKTNKGLTVIYGERGNGKTTLVNHIISNIGKISIFIPCNMIETTINNPEFNTFIKRYKSSVIILDDSELYFSELYTKSNIFTNNLLQLVDGFQSDNLDLNIISVLNVGNIDEIDHTLLDCNNLLDIIEVSPLTTDKANELSKQIGNKGKLKEESKVIDILKKRIFKAEDSEIGFK